MLQWTASGAVSTPRTVQIRVQRKHPERIAVGAPIPIRSLSTQELHANIRFFTEGMRGPRTTPCTRLVLSGIDIASRSDLEGTISLARQLGIHHIVLHCSATDLFQETSVLSMVDRLVLPLPSHVAKSTQIGERLRYLGRVWTGLVRANDHQPEAADRLLLLAMKWMPAELILSAPFPLKPQTPPPDLEKMRKWLDAFARVVEPKGLPWRVQGLPSCYLGQYWNRTRKAGNRWYVDSEHQQDKALRFFPDVMQFHKSDSCRFCIADTHCDGFFPQWISNPLMPPLEPLS